MTFDECAYKSVNNFLALIEIDILRLNVQWINNGAGIWVCNFNNSYPWVASELLQGFTSQNFGDLGSIVVNGISLLKVNTINDVGVSSERYYYDTAIKDLYVSLPNYESPYITKVFIGIPYGFTAKSFQPLNANVSYSNDVLTLPSIGYSRDPLFYGKLSLSDISFTLNNGNGFFDTFAEDYNIYGNPARVKIGFEEISISEYKTIFTGYIGGGVNINEETVSFTISDKRKSFSKATLYTCTNKNALLAIEELLAINYGILYSSATYNTINWEKAKSLVPNITIDLQESTPTIDIIEMICNSVFGIFFITAEGLFDFTIIDDLKSATFFIPSFDILNKFDISYDPSQVISSTKIGYSRNWSTSESAINAYTYLNDIGYEEEVFEKYKIYIEKNINTVLINSSDAQDFSDKIIKYNKDVHGTLPLVVPIQYYEIQVGDNILFEIDRIGKSMLHLRKCEVLSKDYNLSDGLVHLSCRIIKEMFIRVTTTGAVRVLTTGRIRVS